MTPRKKPVRRLLPPPPRAPRPDWEVVAELSGGPVGLLLWMRLRDVSVWSGVSPAERIGLFGPVCPEHEDWERQAAGIEAIAQSVRVLSALARYPDIVKEAEIGRACATISGWAMATDKRETALQFAEAAAIADPYNAMLCAEAGAACVWAAASTPRDADPPARPPQQTRTGGPKSGLIGGSRSGAGGSNGSGTSAVESEPGCMPMSWVTTPARSVHTKGRIPPQFGVGSLIWPVRPITT